MAAFMLTKNLSNFVVNLIFSGTKHASPKILSSSPLPLYGVNIDIRANLRTRSSNIANLSNKDYSTSPLPDETVENSDRSSFISKTITNKINEQIRNFTYNRLFAVIQIEGKQFKVTNEDIIIVQSHISPDIGERIRLEKVLLLGSKDFTLIGRPILSKDLVRIEATVFEKTLSHMKTHFTFKKRKSYRRMRNIKSPYTMLRINTIDLTSFVNEKNDVEGLDDIIL